MVKDDLSGKTFGNLRVLYYIDGKWDKERWRCFYKCGKFTNSLRYNLLYKNVNSCRSCVEEDKAKKYEDIYLEFFYRIKQNAAKRNHEFDLTIEYIWDLYLQQDKKCALSGMPLFWGYGRDGIERNISLDRIDSNKGYIIGNVQWIDKRINKMKMELKEEEFIRLCHLISNFRQN